ncbi:hypothetical protein [Oceaniovalibus sp. ACAM 378]|uniref:hypothetical protein n=1 Tax=Oceaniovalibus sp. ACAM 378 TaxID=2599923 RepID=UPI00165274D6|nr:hypothetical protein [Oceaniovalibus sp. ACAM 378]
MSCYRGITSNRWDRRTAYALFAGLGIELFGQKIVGGGQLPDFGVKILNLVLINLRSFQAGVFEHANLKAKHLSIDGSSLDGRQIADRLLVLQLWMISLPFRHI